MIDRYILQVSTETIHSYTVKHIRFTEKDGIVMLPVKERPYAANVFAYGFLVLIIASFLVAWHD